MEQSIADLAMGIMEDTGMVGDKANNKVNESELPDISDDARASIIESVTGEKQPRNQEVAQQVKPNSNKQYIVTEEEYRTLQRALEIVKEMTTVGMIGTKGGSANVPARPKSLPKTIKPRAAKKGRKTRKASQSVKEWRESLGKLIQ